MTLGDYSLYFGLTLILSTLFAMGGVGSAIALVPSFSMLGMTIDLAKSLGLFVNTASTVTASVMNFRRGVLDFRFALPLVVSILIATPIGAWSSQFVARPVIEGLLIAFLITAALLLLFSRRTTLVTYTRSWPLYLIGGSVGVISGMLGVGGGSLMMPALILLGYDAKKSARAISFVIPFSSAGAFLTYLSFTAMNWPLLATVAVAAILGGYLGERIMHNRLNPAQIKKLIAVLLLLMAAKMLWNFA
ncbi:sulfite exporter TauE/SafE family protein [Thioclava sp.]|uniref:sulfite exporter TauE/SafE family protein n=1 Tax=Thioclava sp. TaxID=1933450 RepID=UPI003AA8E57E